MLQKLSKEKQLQLYIEQQEAYYQNLLNEKDLHIQTLYKTIKDLGLDCYKFEVELSKKLVHEIETKLDEIINDKVDDTYQDWEKLKLEKPKSFLSKIMFWKKN